MIHTKTRRRDLVDELYRLGLSVAYDRVLSISSALGDNICRYFQLEGAVCPPKLKGGLFTTGAVDNIDHNPSSTSAQDSFHDTGISLFQHPNSDVPGVQRIVDTDSIASTATTIVHVPESYTSVPPVILRKRDPPVPKLAGLNRSESHLIPTMQHRFSCRISHPSYSMRSEWMSSGMNTCQTVWRPILEQREEKASGDESSHLVPYQETGRSSYGSTRTRPSCSPS